MEVEVFFPFGAPEQSHSVGPAGTISDSFVAWGQPGKIDDPDKSPVFEFDAISNSMKQRRPTFVGDFKFDVSDKSPFRWFQCNVKFQISNFTVKYFVAASTLWGNSYVRAIEAQSTVRCG